MAPVGKAPDLRELFLKHGPMVYRRARQILGNDADAADATQEIFIRALRGAEGFQGQSQVTTWLYKITTNYCLNALRDRRRRRELFEEHVARSPRPEPAAPADLLTLRRLLVAAPEDQARAAIYVFLDGMSHDEAAELLGVSRRTVGNLLERFQSRAQRAADSQELAALR